MPKTFRGFFYKLWASIVHFHNHDTSWISELRFLLWTESILYVPTCKLFFISCDIHAYLLPLKLLFTYFVKLSTLRSYFINQQHFFNQMVYVPFFSVTSKHLKIACGVCLILLKCIVTLDKWGLSFFFTKKESCREIIHYSLQS